MSESKKQEVLNQLQSAVILTQQHDWLRASIEALKAAATLIVLEMTRAELLGEAIRKTVGCPGRD
jgi:hypothetical protein